MNSEEGDQITLGSKTHQIERFSKNAFRILGLPAHASLSAIQKADESMRRTLKLGVNKPSAWDLPWIGPIERSEADVREALGRLTGTPALRLRERALWFETGERLLSGLTISTLDDSISDRSAIKEVAAQHDLAVLRCLASMLIDPNIKNQDRWSKALSKWSELSENDDYWGMLLESEMNGGFEPCATSGDVDQVRSESLSLMGEILAGMARDAISQGDISLCKRALKSMRAAHLPDSVVAKLESDTFGGREDSFVAACSDVQSECRKKTVRDEKSASANRGACDAAFAQFESEIEVELYRLTEVVGSCPSGERA